MEFLMGWRPAEWRGILDRRERFGDSVTVSGRLHRPDPHEARWDGLAAENWENLTGQPAPSDDAYMLSLDGREGDDYLILPRTTLIRFVEEMERLNDEIAAGTREPRIDTSMPVPPRPAPLRPLVVAEDDEDFDDAPAPVAAAPEEPTVPAPPEPDPCAERDHVVVLDTVDDDMLEDAEAECAKFEVLDEVARAEDYRDVTRDAEAAAKRRTLLFSLETLGVIWIPFAKTMRQRLELLGLTRLLAYHDAAVRLDAYLHSEWRARVGPQRRPPRALLDSAVSLDWFRLPPSPRPAGTDPDEWLAVCERNFVSWPQTGPESGRMYLVLFDRGACLEYRLEAAPMPRLWRARGG
ncbi:MAG: hypothetical protein U1F43_20600 [Myxococcota bacterium]